MKPKNGKWILGHEIFENRDKIVLSDLLHTANYFPLCHLIDGIDVVHSFHPVEISLMHRVYPYVPWPSLRIRTPSFSIFTGGRLGLLNGQRMIEVEGALSQAVQMSKGDLTESLVITPTKQVVLSLEDGHGRLT